LLHWMYFTHGRTRTRPPVGSVTIRTEKLSEAGPLSPTRLAEYPLSRARRLMDRCRNEKAESMRLDLASIFAWSSALLAVLWISRAASSKSCSASARGEPQ
jgi:hypothetical protein